MLRCTYTRNAGLHGIWLGVLLTLAGCMAFAIILVVMKIAEKIYDPVGLLGILGAAIGMVGLYLVLYGLFLVVCGAAGFKGRCPYCDRYTLANLWQIRQGRLTCIWCRKEIIVADSHYFTVELFDEIYEDRTSKPSDLIP